MKSVLVIGLGRFGTYMAQKLQALGNEVMAVELSEERANDAVNIIPEIQIADARNDDVIKSLGVDNFDFCVVAVGDNFLTSLEVTVLLKDMGAKYVIARAARDVHKKLLLRNGADYVVYAEKDMAEKLAMKFGAKNVFDYYGLTDVTGIYEIATPKRWIGRTILEIDVRSKYNISIIAYHSGEEINPMLITDYVFSPKDTLFVVGEEKAIKKVTQ